jgi:hypothetical protein
MGAEIQEYIFLSLRGVASLYKIKGHDIAFVKTALNGALLGIGVSCGLQARSTWVP